VGLPADALASLVSALAAGEFEDLLDRVDLVSSTPIAPIFSASASRSGLR
jgi:hypothetical protein